MSNEIPFLERLNIRVKAPDTEAYQQEFNSVMEELNQVNNEFEQYLDKPLKDEYDVVIIGSGPGGGTLAHALKDTGKSILLVERGDFLPQEPDNWNSTVVLEEQKYANSEEWVAADGTSYQPNMYYYVGGMTKLYAGTLFRFRQEDFQESRHQDGISPVWPVQYDEFEPHYTRAEQLYFVHGKEGEDPTEPARSGPFPYPAAPLVSELEEFKKRMGQVGLHPFAVPQGLALFAGGRCLYCGYCDSHPCQVLAKGDPELCCIRPAVRKPEVTLLTKAKAVRLLTDPSGSNVVAVEIEREGHTYKIHAGTFVVSGGAVNTPVLLLRSANEHHPNGLGNSSGLVGANYMRHVSTVVLAQNPAGVKLPQNHFWKTIGFNDYYLNGTSDCPYPLGTVQVTGNYHESMPIFLPDSLDSSEKKRQELAGQMLPLFLLSEDLPRTENRVSLTSDGRISVAYQANNVDSHKKFIEVVIDKLKQAGYGLMTYKTFLDVKQGGGYHHCGTARFGNDPATSVLDRYCKVHDLENLYIVDACFFPSAPALNPVLTIVANALRVGDYLKCKI